MRSIMRHALLPGFRGDAVDDLDVVTTPEVAALCRAVANDTLPPLVQLRARKELDQQGLTLCGFSDRDDATHCLMTRHNVYLLRL